MSGAASFFDAVLEAPVVPSFTRIGYAIRKRLFDWQDLDDYRLEGRVMAITGPTSGLGKATATHLARAGATTVLIARDETRTKAVRDEIAEASGNDAVSYVLADLGHPDQVRAAAGQILDRHPRLDVLVHNAGALFNDRREAETGIELTVQVQVLSPFLLTGLLLPRLVATDDSRVLTMSSGGMYTAPLTVDHLQMSPDSYNGAKQYARAKRAQVTLTEMWAERVAGQGVVFHSLHPGWADTPGVEAALPGFRKVVGPLLRDADQGADTLVWLAADDGAPLQSNGRFWHDRRPRSIHKLRSTRASDTPDRRRALWQWVVEQSGLDPDEPGTTG